MELQDALTQIGDIRLQMCRTRRFRGYGAVTTLCTGLAAIGAGIWQARHLPYPGADPMSFVNLWVGVAMGCAAIAGLELMLGYRNSDSPLQRELTVLAIEQILPAMIAGGLVTLILCGFNRPALWMLPGLWQIFFGLGIFASRRILPPPIALVGVFYVAAGLFNLAADQNAASFSPWAMALPFGVGQAACAVILHRASEAHHAS